MLYGNMDCHDGVNPYEPSDLQLGLHTIQISSVHMREKEGATEENILYVRGEYFTKSSVVCVNGEEWHGDLV